MKYYLIAGERSGDLHGSNLIKALRKHDPEAVFQGFGGEYMKNAGMTITVDYHDMAFMGFVAVMANLRTIRRLMDKCKEDIVAFNPDVVVLIDYAGFNMRIARFAKEKGLKVFYYISPKVWAWNTGRAWKLKKNVDRLFAILPFEKDFFKKFDWEIDYVGNPVLDAIKDFHQDPLFLRRHQLTDRNVVALLPGSRRMELKRMIPVMAEVVRRNTQYSFVVAAVKSLPPELYAPLRSLSNVQFVYDETYDLLTHARAAIVTSGTATLETGLFKVPQVVIYKAGALEYQLLKRLVKVPFISLVNLIAGKAVIRELIQHDMTPDQLNAELKNLVEDKDRRSQMQQDYESVYRLLDTGSASENAGRLMVSYLT